MIGKSWLTLVTKFDLTTVTKQNSALKEFFLIQGLFFHSSNPELLAQVFWKQQPVVLQKSYLLLYECSFFYFSVLARIFYLKIYAKWLINIKIQTISICLYILRKKSGQKTGKYHLCTLGLSSNSSWPT